jgi:hypothetical protein
MRKAKTKKKAGRAWTKDEVKLLKRLFPQGRAREIVKRTGRSLEAVKHKAYGMGIKTRENRPWSASEIRQLKRLYPSETIQSIADKLGRSYKAVVAKAHELGLTEELRVWSKRELNLLKRLYPSRTAQEIAEQIGRSVHAIRKKIVKLGLRKRFRYDDCHRVVNGTKEKLCRKCSRWQAGSEFRKDRAREDGLRIYCKGCDKAYELKRRRKNRKGKKTRVYLKFEDRHRVVNGVKEKLCTKCRRWKRESGFYKNRSGKDGLGGQCKKCSYKPNDKVRKKRRSAAKN